MSYNGSNYFTLAHYLAANRGLGITGMTRSVVPVASANFAGGSPITTVQVTELAMIPEPTSLALATIGIAAAAWVDRRRRTGGGAS